MSFRPTIVFLAVLGACDGSDGSVTRHDGAVDADSSGGDAAGVEVPDDRDAQLETADDAATELQQDDSREDAAPAPADGEVLEDAVGAPSGSPCEREDECRSGWCVPSAIGQVCVDTCVDVCEPGEQCIPAADAGTDPVYLCIPFVAPSPDAEVGGDATADATDPDAVSEGDATPTDALADGGPLDDVITTDVGPEPDVSGPDTVVSDPDSDGDGIPDADDNLPCLAIYLVVYNQGVTAATLSLNGTEIVGSSAFPTADPITVFINPTSGDNTLALGGQLTGSPSDSLTLVVVDTDGHIYFATVIQRTPGKPFDHTYTFAIDVTCP